MNFILNTVLLAIKEILKLVKSILSLKYFFEEWILMVLKVNGLFSAVFSHKMIRSF